MTSPLLPTSLATAILADGTATRAMQGNSVAGQSYTDIRGLEALKGDPHSPKAVAAVAQQLEAMFLQMMLKSMREASLGDGIFDSDQGKMYQDMFDKQIALDMSRHQQLGISELLMRQLAGKSGQQGGGLPGDAPSAGVPAAGVPVGVLPTGSATPVTATPPGIGDLQGRTTRGIASEADAAEFTRQVLPAIRQAARRLGVDARALLAQAALETGWGQRVPRNADGASSFNLFGIKAGASWNGARTTAATLEFDGLVARRTNASFRVYGSIEESVNDFAQLLAGSPRYSQALSQGADGPAFIRALAGAGYATDPEYASKVNRIQASDRIRSAFPVRTAALQK
ncbi:MAG: flagellar assembly peptidoglycan hydrolase FlgJ [Steroidobacteraceae bacterium]